MLAVYFRQRWSRYVKIWNRVAARYTYTHFDQIGKPLRDTLIKRLRRIRPRYRRHRRRKKAGVVNLKLRWLRKRGIRNKACTTKRTYWPSHIEKFQKRLAFRRYLGGFERKHRFYYYKKRNVLARHNRYSKIKSLRMGFFRIYIRSRVIFIKRKFGFFNFNFKNRPFTRWTRRVLKLRGIAPAFNTTPGGLLGRFSRDKFSTRRRSKTMRALNEKPADHKFFRITATFSLFFLVLLENPILLMNYIFTGGVTSMEKRLKPYKKNLTYKSIYLYQNLVNFLENKTSHLVYLNIIKTKAVTLSSRDNALVSVWAIKLSRFKLRFKNRFDMRNFVLIVYYSLKNRDLTLMLNLFQNAILRLKFWQHRMFFKFIVYLFAFQFVSAFRSLKLRGIHFEVKGKISLGGNSRKKKIVLKLRKTFRSNIKLKSAFKFKPINTISGALGLKLWIYYT